MTRVIEEMNTELKVGGAELTPDNPFARALGEMKDGVDSIPAKTNPANVALVTRYFDRIIAVVPPQGGR
jgi:hypothetical protein